MASVKDWKITVSDTRKKHLQIVEQFQNNGRQANAFGNIVYIFTQLVPTFMELELFRVK